MRVIKTNYFQLECGGEKKLMLASKKYQTVKRWWTFGQNKHWAAILLDSSTIFWPVFPFNTPWKHDKTFSLLTFSGGIKSEHWPKERFKIYFENSHATFQKVTVKTFFRLNYSLLAWENSFEKDAIINTFNTYFRK